MAIIQSVIKSVAQLVTKDVLDSAPSSGPVDLLAGTGIWESETDWTLLEGPVAIGRHGSSAWPADEKGIYEPSGMPNGNHQQRWDYGGIIDAETTYTWRVNGSDGAVSNAFSVAAGFGATAPTFGVAPTGGEQNVLTTSGTTPYSLSYDMQFTFQGGWTFEADGHYGGQLYEGDLT